MKFRLHLIAFLLIVSSFLLTVAATAQPPSDVVPGRYIVALKAGASPEGVIAGHGLAADRIYRSAVNGFAGAIPPGQVRAIEADPDVLEVIPDRVVKAVGTGIVAAKAAGKPGPKPTPTPAPQVVPAGVERIGGDPTSALWTGNGVGVAIVDTGLDFPHEDLNVASAASSFTAYGSTAQDDNGHGTHVGGIVAAKNNTVDVVGVAPEATLYAVKVLDSTGSGLDSTIIDGLDWVHANAALVSPPIRVVNMSLGRAGTVNDDPALHAAVQSLYAAGIAVVVAAGNDSKTEVSQQVPATYPEVLAIASTTALTGTSQYRSLPGGIVADTASYFTTDGAFDPGTGIGVSISAPGESQENVSRAGGISSIGILSTKLGGGTVRMSGTSMAAPHVAGVAARFFEATPDVTDVEVLRGLIRSNVSRLGTAPLNSPTSSYSFDGEREGIVMVPDLWTNP